MGKIIFNTTWYVGYVERNDLMKICVNELIAGQILFGGYCIHTQAFPGTKVFSTQQHSNMCFEFPQLWQSTMK